MAEKTKQKIINKKWLRKENLMYKSHTEEYKKNYQASGKVISVRVPKEEADEWKHELGLGPLARQLMRAYFAGKIQIDL